MPEDWFQAGCMSELVQLQVFQTVPGLPKPQVRSVLSEAQK